MEWVAGSNKTKLSICLPHHKNESRWGHLPIQFELPPYLAAVLLAWIQHGHAQVAAPGQRLLLVHKNSGLGLTNVNLSQVCVCGGGWEGGLHTESTMLRCLYGGDFLGTPLVLCDS